MQCVGAGLSTKLAFIAFFHLYPCFTFAIYLCTSLKLHWSIPNNPTDRSQSNNPTVTQSSNALPYVTSVQYHPHNRHHRTPQWGNMNSPCRYFKIYINFTLKSLPQSSKSIVPSVSCHKFMLFSFPHTLYVHKYEAASLHCCFHLILEDSWKCKQSYFKLRDQLQSIQPNSKVTQHPIQWVPEVPSPLVKWLQRNVDQTISRLGMNGAWQPLQHKH